MNIEKLMKIASAVRTGGKGSVRRSVIPTSVDISTRSCPDGPFSD